jgi:hypothetical protein
MVIILIVIVVPIVIDIPWPCLPLVGHPLPLLSQVGSSRPREDQDCPRGVSPPTGLGHFGGLSPLRGTPR